MKYILKKDLPFAEKGTEVIKKYKGAADECWVIKAKEGEKEFFVADAYMSVSEWIEEVKERLDIFPNPNPKLSLKESFYPNYRELSTRGRQGKFYGYNIRDLPIDNLYFIIAYLASHIESGHKSNH